MRLIQLDIENFRRIESATVHFSGASFLVGPNNTGKSSIIAAIEALLTLEKGHLSPLDILERADGTLADRTTITGYFGEIAADVAASRGFRGRVVAGTFVYRKSITSGSTKVMIETQEYPSTSKSQFAAAKTVRDLLDGGIAADVVKDALDTTEPDTKLPKDWRRSIPEAVEFDLSAEPTWVANPGGIPQNVLSRLPRLIHIPAITDSKEIESDEKRFALGECLSLLFEDLIGANPLATAIETNLKALEGQMDPADNASLVHKLVREINAIIETVFPKCGIDVKPSLQNLIAILQPQYDIKVFSNIRTGAARQGTGLIRTCAFAMLRYHARLKLEKELQTRPILVAFEEPELFLHPSAANLLRDTIYALGRSDQIVCTTHSPWMIDLGRDPQSVTRTAIGHNDCAVAINYGVSSALGRLAPDDRDRVKVIQVFDDELSRVFFAERVVVVEGDSEVLAIRNTIRLLPDAQQKAIAARYQVVKARGKASIISLARYLRELHIDPLVIHDRDLGTPGAEVFNEPIAKAVGNPKAVVVLDNCLEDVLGYPAPSNDKPFRAYTQTAKWKSIDEVPAQWMEALRATFSEVMGT